MTSEGTSGSADRSRDAPLELVAHWKAAEERLYPVVMVSPDVYERAVRLVGALVSELERSTPDMGALVEAAPGLADRAARLAGEGEMTTAGLDLPLIAAAACAMRHRTLVNQACHQERIARIARAAAAGEAWVVVQEGGQPTTWPPLPTTTIEMHLPTGTGLVETVEVDDETGAPRFVLGELRLDPRTGEPLGPTPQVADIERFEDVVSWRDAIVARRRRGPQSH
jgi:hypothetical protein